MIKFRLLGFLVLLVFSNSLIFTALHAQTFSTKLVIPSALSGKVIDLTIKKGTLVAIPGKTSNTYGINEMSYLGPTLILKQGDALAIDIHNNLTEAATVHWHGMHVPAKWDGGPMNPIAAGATWSPRFVMKNIASTLWYHSHLHLNTLRQVDMGLAGLVIVQDTNEAKLSLPRTYGVDDLPLILQDKSIDGMGQFAHKPLGDYSLVNGTYQPFVEAPAQIVRLRVLNAAAERVYYIGFSDNRSFSQIGLDGGLLEKPIAMTRIRLAPGERAELVVDLSSDLGKSFYMMSYSAELGVGFAGAIRSNGPGSGTGPLDSANFNVLRFQVTAQTATPILTIRQNLVPINFYSRASVTRTRTKNLLGPIAPGKPFTIDGTSYNMAINNDTVRLGATEIWKFVNKSPLGHPIHMHDVQFNIITRGGVPTTGHDLGWKDIVFIPAKDSAEVIARFDDYADPDFAYMLHCHMLSHEDDGMMQQFIVLDTASAGVGRAALNATTLAYPNPTSGSVYMNLPKSHASVFVYDMTGRSLDVPTNAGSIDLSGCVDGVYLIRIQTDASPVRSIKIVKTSR